jgi:hypothetical protein
MPLSLHIAKGNARRVAGRKGPAKLSARIRVLRPHCGLRLLLEYKALLDYTASIKHYFAIREFLAAQRLVRTLARSQQPLRIHAARAMGLRDSR